MSDLYDILGVAKNATKDAIKRAYRKKAKKSHPDRAGGDNAEMSAINQAYAVLSDDKKRAHYDSTGQDKPQPTIEDFAIQSLAKAFDDMLADEAPAGNVVKIIRRAINKAIGASELELKICDAYLKKLDKRATQVKKRADDDGLDLWTKVIADRRQRYRANIEMLKRNVEISKKALELLDQYEGIDTSEASPPRPPDLSSIISGWG